MDNLIFDLKALYYQNPKEFILDVYDRDLNKTIILGQTDMFARNIIYSDAVSDEMKKMADAYYNENVIFFNDDDKIGRIVNILKKCNNKDTYLATAWSSNITDNSGYAIPDETGYLIFVDNDKMRINRLKGKRTDYILGDNVDINKADFQEIAETLLDDIQKQNDVYTIIFDSLR